MPENGTLKHITTCKLCGQRFSNSALPVIGESPASAIVSFVNSLAKHMGKAHPQETKQLFAETARFYQNFTGWAILQQFQSEDPNLLKSTEGFRAWMAALSRKNQISDAEITNMIVAAEPLTQESAETVCKKIRDFLTEQGRYAGQGNV